MFTKLRLRSLLMYLGNLEFTSKQVASINEQFRKAILDFGSETPDNIEGVTRVEVGPVQADNYVYSGIKIKDKEIRLSQLMHSIESMDLPESVKADFPELTQEDWDGATRIMTLVLMSLEDEKALRRKNAT
jgi:hypothetical protein